MSVSQPLIEGIEEVAHATATAEASDSALHCIAWHRDDLIWVVGRAVGVDGIAFLSALDDVWTNNERSDVRIGRIGIGVGLGREDGVRVREDARERTYRIEVGGADVASSRRAVDGGSYFSSSLLMLSI